MKEIELIVEIVVGAAGFEPATARSTAASSARLSYTP